ncbi:MAG: phosphate ABC transporter substrate-binding protein PstS [Chitinivibrionales bacterium]|nr:phosphate ABC transporter substrate-binding protein PstS [Chitinivibrionales bacterium]MBD3394123.1 phosphate ABC transporter substrate-binding protein PstS [Chitinivibrionales bacterium]
MNHSPSSRRRIGLAIIVLVFASLANAANVELLGAGASFPYPLYSKMFDVYHKKYGVRINYQSIGSGGGIRQLESRSIDFGASDAVITDEKLQKMPGSVLHVPTCLGAVVVTYNLPGNPELRLGPDVLAEIFLGKIKRWNDSRIVAINPNAKLPKDKIMVVHRSDGSGTTFIFTDYLSKVSPEWKKSVGAGKSVKWPAGLGAKGNEGVSGLVKQTRGSIGYCELAYALHNNLPQALIKNEKGHWIRPTIESISLAAQVEIPSDARVSLTNTGAGKGYPISSFTWILLYQEQNYDKRPKDKAKTLVDLLWWMTHDGQKHCAPLDYAPLSDAAVKRAEEILKSVVYDGDQIRK